MHWISLLIYYLSCVVLGLMLKQLTDNAFIAVPVIILYAIFVFIVMVKRE